MIFMIWSLVIAALIMGISANFHIVFYTAHKFDVGVAKLPVMYIFLKCFFGYNNPFTSQQIQNRFPNQIVFLSIG